MQVLPHTLWPAALLCALAVPGTAQEVQGQRAASGPPTIAKAPNVTQDMLNAADHQGVNWLHTNGGYAQQKVVMGPILCL